MLAIGRPDRHALPLTTDKNATRLFAVGKGRQPDIFQRVDGAPDIADPHRSAFL
jgi:hypothetical protein